MGLGLAHAGWRHNHARTRVAAVPSLHAGSGPRCYGINIYNGVRYLMDCNEAASVLGVRVNIASRVSLATPGFPRNTMFYIGYDGNFEGHFNRLYLVTDAANKVVSIQLVDEHPKVDAQAHRRETGVLTTSSIQDCGLVRSCALRTNRNVRAM